MVIFSVAQVDSVQPWPVCLMNSLATYHAIYTCKCFYDLDGKLDHLYVHMAIDVVKLLSPCKNGNVVKKNPTNVSVTIHGMNEQRGDARQKTQKFLPVFAASWPS